MHFKGTEIPKGDKFNLKNCPTSFSGGRPKRIRKLLADVSEDLRKFQEVLYAQGKYGLLIVLQGIDTAGKDGVVKFLISGLNPAACDVRSFKAPNSDEVRHDFLWRSAKEVPARGQIMVFNRSHYEEVVAVRVHPQFLVRQNLSEELSGQNIWEKRFEQIRNWEQYLVENGIGVLKFFLTISKEEQRQRLLARVDTPSKNWKFSESDVHEREFWADNLKAWSRAIAATSTKRAPWHIIPANDKKMARLAVGHIVLEYLKKLPLAYPHLGRKEHQEALATLKSKLENEGGKEKKKDDGEKKDGKKKKDKKKEKKKNKKEEKK